MSLNVKEQTQISLINFNYSSNLEVRDLLDVISSILAQEYIKIAKENKEKFKKGGLS